MTTYSVESLDPLDDLALDPRNPRLRRDEENSSQERLIEILVRRFKIEELAESLLTSGYLTFDPIIAYRSDESVFVREGNRRLAAIKLLLAPELAPERSRSRWEALAGRVTDAFRDQVRPLEIQVYADVNDIELNSYIGFRHVTGVLQWPSLEKASFIAQLVDQGMSYRDIAERLGSYPKHVERHFIAHQLVRQAVSDGIEGFENLEDSFGVLLRALQASGIAEFIGVTYPSDPEASREPIPADKREQFEEFIRWTFGTPDRKRILPDSRRLTDWGKVLQSEQALQYLRVANEPTFERAWFRSGGQAESVRDGVWAATYRLEEVVPLAVAYREDEEVAVAVSQLALFFVQIVQNFPEIAAEYNIGDNGAGTT